MKYLVRTSFVDVVGKIWMPMVTCSMRYPLREYDLEQMRNESGLITRDDVAQWLCTHTGDFSHIQDFRASLEDGDKTLDFPWATEKGEILYNDTLADESEEEL